MKVARSDLFTDPPAKPLFCVSLHKIRAPSPRPLARFYIGTGLARPARGLPSMVKGAALRSLSCRGSQVQILPHALPRTPRDTILVEPSVLEGAGHRSLTPDSGRGGLMRFRAKAVSTWPTTAAAPALAGRNERSESPPPPPPRRAPGAG